VSDSLQSLRELLERAERLTEDVHKLSDSKEALEGDILRIKGQKDLYERQAAEAKDQWEADKLHFETQRQKHGEEIARMDATAQMISRETVAVTEQKIQAIEIFENTKDIQETELARLAAAIAEKQQEHDNLDKLMETKLDIRNGLDATIATRRGELDKLETDYQAKLAEKDTTSKQSYEQVEANRRELAKVQADIVEAQATLEELSAILVAKQPQIDELEQERKRFEQAKAKAEKSLDAREQSLSEREKDLEQRIALSKRRTVLE
jgi:chromosome segregation ATPase